jgi:hypothetical protein
MPLAWNGFWTPLELIRRTCSACLGAAFTIACRADGEPRWSERLQLNDAVSARGTITMSVSVDEASKVNEK